MRIIPKLKELLIPKLLIILPISFLFFVHNCTHYYYAPNAHNIPLFEEKNELTMQVSRSRGKEFESFDLSMAYAFSERFAVITNGFIASDGNDNEWGRGKFVEMGLGYFNTAPEGVIYELYSGFGAGFVKNNYESQKTSLVNYNRFFIQPNLGYRIGFFEMSMSTRFCLLNLYNIDYPASLSDVNLEDLTHLSHNRVSLLAEPALTFRLGVEPINLQLQLIHSQNLTCPNLKQETINLNLGLFLSF